ncbi:MAG TPA: hypothetical protein VGR71_16715 [Nitrospira sp.]|nr:hypothetical protein [Nitrospira sp.]
MAYRHTPRHDFPADVPAGTVKLTPSDNDTTLVELGRDRYTKRFQLQGGPTGEALQLWLALDAQFGFTQEGTRLRSA